MTRRRQTPPGKNGAGAVPTPADLVALTERLHELGAEQATIEKLAAKFGVKQATLEGWARRQRPFGPEHAALAAQIETALQNQISKREAEREEAAKGRPNGGAGGTSQDKPAPDDADAAWEKMQKEQRRQQDGRTAHNDPMALQERFDAALERLENATPRPATLAHGLIEAADGVLDFDDQFRGPLVLPPKITDRLTRGEIHMLVADPNVGKTTLAYLLALAIADENAALIGQIKIDWCGHALVVSNEDASGNGAARWREQRAKLGMSGRLKNSLSIWPKRLTLGRFEDNVLVPTEEGCEFVETLAARAERGVHYAYMILDPLTGLFPGVSENNPTQMNDAVVLTGRIAKASFAAVDLVHHTSKSTRGEETVTAYRGATGIEAALDEMSTFAVLLPAELTALGFPPNTRARSIVRLKGQRKRNSSFAGTYYFEREVLHVPAVDSRKPDEMAAEFGTVAVMTVIAPPARPSVNLNDAHRWLWEEFSRNGKVKLSCTQGRGKKPSPAAQILMENSDCDQPVAERTIDDLQKAGRIQLEKGWSNGNRIKIAVPAPPPAVPDSADETENPF